MAITDGYDEGHYVHNRGSTQFLCSKCQNHEQVENMITNDDTMEVKPSDETSRIAQRREIMVTPKSSRKNNNSQHIALQSDSELQTRREQIQISEEIARSTSNLADDSEPVHEIHRKLNDLINIHTPEGMKILQQSIENTRFKHSKVGWKELKDWDKSIPCSDENCEHIVLKTRASNTIDLWNETYRLFKKLLISDSSDDDFSPSGILGDVMNYDNRNIDWSMARGCIWHAKLKAEFPDIDVQDLEDNTIINVGHHSIEVGEFAYGDSNFSKLELKAIEQIDPMYGALCHLLNMCDSKPLMCPNGHDLWDNQRSTESDNIHDFRQSTKMAIESCIRTIVGSAVNRPPKSLIGRIGDKKVKVSRGKVSGKSSSRIKRAISEAAIICNLQLGEFSVPYLSEEITFRPEDNISTRVFSAINTKVVEDLANKLKLLKPYPFFLLEGKGSIQWNDWAGDRAINILHAFNLRGFVIRDDQAWDFQNSDGSLPYRTTNMLNLSNDLNKEINDLFVIESQNGGKFNSLELLLNRETTPPMVCEPSNRTCDDNKSSMFEMILEVSKHPICVLVIH